VVVDTGPLVAYLDARDPAHVEVANRLDVFTGVLATTGAVITEAMHFVSATRGGPRLLADLVRTSGMRVFDLCRPPEIDAAAALMEKYADPPWISPMPRSSSSPRPSATARSSPWTGGASRSSGRAGAAVPAGADRRG